MPLLVVRCVEFTLCRYRSGKAAQSRWLPGTTGQRLRVMPSEDQWPSWRGRSQATPVAGSFVECGRSEGRTHVDGAAANFLVLAEGGMGSAPGEVKQSAAESASGWRRVLRYGTCARRHAGMKSVCHGLPLYLGLCGSRLRADISAANTILRSIRSPFGNLATPRVPIRWAHGFASPPYDGFAGSG